MHKFPGPLSVLAAVALSAPLANAAPMCGADVDACARLLVLENAGFMAACGAAYPAARPVFERAYKGWPVLKMSIPGVAESVREGSPARINAAFDANEALRTMTPEARNEECSTRLANLTQRTPTLTGKAGNVSAEALKKYTAEKPSP